MKNYTHIPAALIQEKAKIKSFAKGMRVFAKLKMRTAKQQVLKKDVPGWKSAARLGLLTEDPNNNRKLYVKSYKSWKGKRVKLLKSDVEGDMLAAAHAILLQYQLCIHGTREEREGRKPASRNHERALKPSAHNGGIALSQHGKVAHRSKSTCSRMRRRIEKAGYGTFVRRSVLISHAAGDEEQRVLPASYAGCGRLWTDGHGKLWKEVTSEARLNHFEFSCKRIYNRPGTKPKAKSWAKQVERRAWYDH